jgi:DNA repair protein RadC
MKPKGPVWKIPQYRVKLVRERTISYPVRAGETESPPYRVEAAEIAARVLHALLDDADREKVVCLYLNGQNVLIGAEIVAIGGMHSCGLAPRDILKGLLLANASAFIMGHNHLSGDPTPSEEDKELTSLVRKLAGALGTPLVDHVIVSANGRHTSFLNAGLMKDDS